MVSKYWVRLLLSTVSILIASLTMILHHTNPARAINIISTTGSGRFIAHSTTPSFGGGYSHDIALGDLDGDGDLDAIVAQANDQPQTVWTNDGQGNFTPHPVTPHFGAGNSSAIVLGDLDNDGDLDTIVANFDDQAETVWLNDGAGNYSPHPQGAAFGTGNSNDLVLGDLDGDGDLDAIVANSFLETDTVWINNGQGQFNHHSQASGFGKGISNKATLGDIDNDGDLDLLIANISGDHILWTNDGAANFSLPSVSPNFITDFNNDIAFGDIDSDGDLDAVVATNRPLGNNVWINDGFGIFAPHKKTKLQLGPASDIALGDIDNDGDLDVVAARYANFPQRTLLNDGLGHFTPHSTTPNFGSNDSLAIALGDLDGDSDLDALIANASDQPQTVWVNENLVTNATTKDESHLDQTYIIRIYLPVIQAD